MILENFEQLNKDQRQTFADICNKLLSYSFLAKDKKDNKDQYYFVINYKHYFDEIFSVLGHELIVNRELGAIQLINSNYQSTMHLKREESLVLLIIRILYHEKLIETTLNDNVVVTVSDIHDKYDLLGFKRKIYKTELERTLRLFKRYNLIENIGEIAQSATKLIIYPTITMAISTTNIQDVYNYINQLNVEEGDKGNEKVN